MPVLIDTLIPTFCPNSSTLRFAVLMDKAKYPWFLFVEKAYVKINGSYSATIGSTFIQTIYSLYGYYSARKKEIIDFRNSTKRTPYEYLSKYEKEKAIMGASTNVQLLSKILIKTASFLVIHN